jgi:hypothetical protein
MSNTHLETNMKIRINNAALARLYGLNTTDAYDVVRLPDPRVPWGPLPSTPFKDTDGDYWIDSGSGGGKYKVAAVDPALAEVVE